MNKLQVNHRIKAMHLTDSIRIRGRQFKNRTVMAPMVPNMAGRDGAVTPEYSDFYEARAQAGVGYIVLGAVYVHPDGRGFDRQLGINDDRLVPGLRRLADRLKAHTRVGIQLSFKSIGRRPETFGRSEIDTYRTAFARAARRARDVGVDAIELHACHDYWLNFFLSPHFNNRNDEYGGTLERRQRLLIETVQEVRNAVGKDLLLGVRLSMDEFVADGLVSKETMHIAGQMEHLGVDYIHASGGIGLTQHRMSPPMEVDRGSLLPLARALKQRVEIPVIGVGRLDRPDVWRRAISSGAADMAAVGRGLIADPAYAQKTLENREQDIRPCVACNFCLHRLHEGQALRCVVNPYVGRDMLKPPPLARSMAVIVAGGGPAGLSCALEASRRGAQVRLYDSAAELGGMVRIGLRPPHKGVLQDLIDYFRHHAQANGVEIRLGETVSQVLLRSQKAEKLVLATGATNITLSIPGIDTGPPVKTAVDVLASDTVPAGRYLIVGGGAVGLETAEYLAQFETSLTVIETTESLGSGLHLTRLNGMLERLDQCGVRIETATAIQAVHLDMVRVETATGTAWIGPFDCLVFAVGARSNRALAQDMDGKVPIAIIGDAAQPRSIYEAISEGLDVALKL